MKAVSRSSGGGKMSFRLSDGRVGVAELIYIRAAWLLLYSSLGLTQDVRISLM